MRVPRYNKVAPPLPVLTGEKIDARIKNNTGRSPASPKVQLGISIYCFVVFWMEVGLFVYLWNKHNGFNKNSAILLVMLSLFMVGVLVSCLVTFRRWLKSRSLRVGDKE